MSQAQNSITETAATGNTATETAMAQAMTDATKAKATITGKKPVSAGKMGAASKMPQATNGKQPPARAAARSAQTRAPLTAADVTALCPHQGLADNLARTFGLEPVDMDGISEATSKAIRDLAAAITTNMNDRAMAMHLQRITGAHVGSAIGAGRFYSDKVSEARRLTAAGANDDRDEDRDGVAGFDSRAQRARLFAAEVGLQAAALRAAAEGALDAYEHLTGEAWKPYQSQQDTTRTVARRAATEEINAFG